MKNIYFIFILTLALIAISGCGPAATNAPLANTNSQSANLNTNNSGQNINLNQNINATNNADFQPPLDRASERVTKKTFDLYITPQNSPISPERFTGFHTGADFEIFPEELNTEVPVKAICSGTLKLKETASGYGGVAVQNCELNGEAITVVYGHLKLSGIAKRAGENLTAGETLGILGAGYSAETDGERKHLHLSIHKGASTNITGYVSAENDLSEFMDPCLYVCHN
jgi:murein DD-endopeptidase MepM/ murein hydrolase activator NlpD